MEMGFLDALAMIALGIRQAEETLLEERTIRLVSVTDQPKRGTLGTERKTYSFSFQKEKAMFWKPWVSQTPAIPSSPQRYVRNRV